MKSILFFSFIFMLNACSSGSIKNFESHGTSNFTVTFKSDNGPFSNSDLYLYLFDLLPGCKYTYLGELKIANQSATKISLPLKHQVGFRTEVKKNRIFGDNTTLKHGLFLLATKPHLDYGLEVIVENDSVSKLFYFLQGDKRSELESQEDHCPNSQEVL